jgi:L-lactate permease
MSEKSFLENHRWELCKAYLERADKSGELLRALLFAVGSAGTGFCLRQSATGNAKCHIFAAALFGLGVGVVFWSWDLQKRKARDRFTTVRDDGINEYLKKEKTIQINRAWDISAFVLLAVGAALEFWLAFIASLHT